MYQKELVCANLIGTDLDALESLLRRNLVRHDEGNLYELTGEGFKVARSIKQQSEKEVGQLQGEGKLEALINHVPVKAYDGYVEHALIIGLVNSSSKSLGDYRVELQVPDAFTNQSTTYDNEVQGRRTPEYRYFRTEGKDHIVKLLRPGDKEQTFLKIELIVPPDATQKDDYDKKIIVKVFAGDVITQKLETTVRSLLALPPSFG